MRRVLARAMLDRRATLAEPLQFPAPSAPDAPPDLLERLRALDPARSFLVQAPAGSGKTYLLTQRFLRLLGQAEKPDEIVAITFTNAAAAEMRNRILNELEKAEQEKAERGPYVNEEAESLGALAHRAMAHSQAMGWQILDQPNQLRITTIDAFCRGLALLCPLNWGLLSGLGGRLEPVEHPKNLYRRAASRTMERLLGRTSEQPDTVASMEALMLWRDNNWKDVEDLLVEMLGNRNRWYQDFVFDREVDWPALRERLEAPFCRAARARLERLASLLDMVPEARERALELARFACGCGGKSVPTGLAERAEFPECMLAEAEAEEAAMLEDAVAAHHELARFLLPKEGGWRSARGLNVIYGFPATPQGKAAKARFAELVADLEAEEGLRAALATFQQPIPTRFSDEEWELVHHCFAILRAAAIELQLVFAETGGVDFTEIAQIALRVLAPEDGLPSEFAIRQADSIRHLLIDEFQDTSRNQHQLLARLIAAWPEREGRSCFCVGDPMQSIYGFREAEVELFERLKTHGLESRASDYYAADWVAEPFRFDFVPLRANFRTAPSLVEDLNGRFAKIFAEDDGSGVTFSPAEAARSSASTVRTELHLAFTKTLRGLSKEEASAEEEGHPDQTRKAQLAEMVELICSKLEQGATQRALDPKAKFRIAVLGRTKKSLILVADALRKAGVGYRAIDLVPLDKRPEVLDALAIARALVNPMDRTAWLGVLRAPWCGLTLEELHRLTSADNDEILHQPVPVLLEKRLEELHREDRIAERAYEAATRVGRVMKAAVDARAAGGAAALGTWLESVWKALGGADTVIAEERENLRLLWAALDKLEGGELDLLGPELKTALSTLCAQPDPATSHDFGAQLMTIHKSKGLEFEVVLVPDLESTGKTHTRTLVSWLERGLAESSSGEVTEFLVAPIQGKGEKAGPAKQWVDGVKQEREQQELRRLLYVAATRAREELHLFARPRYAQGKKEQEGALVLEAPKGLLATAWPAFQSEVESRFATFAHHEEKDESVALAAEAGDADTVLPMALQKERAVRPVRLHRLPIDQAVPELRWLGAAGRGQGDSASREDEEAASEALYARTEGGLRSRLDGKAIHLLLERLADLRTRLQPEDAAEALRTVLPRTIAMIRSQGLSAGQARTLAEEALTVVQRASTDPAGAWILSPHPQAQAESRWTGLWDGQARSLRPDRVFLAPAPMEAWTNLAAPSDEPTWWIIDYKTSRAAGINLADPVEQLAYLTAQRAKYEEQLAAYAHLLRQLLRSKGATAVATPPIRTGIFYPRLRLFDGWDA